MGRCYYITFDVPEGEESKYISAVPTFLKARYICSKFNGNLNVISLAPKKCMGFGKKQKNSYGTLKMLFSFGGRSRIGKRLDFILRKIYLFFFIKFVVKKDDKVLIYHSYTYTKFLSKIINAKKILPVLQVEEIYGYNAVEDKPYLQDEIMCIKKFGKFIFVNDYIPLELGVDKEKCVVSYGVVDSDYKRFKKTSDKEKIHVLYAGTIEDKKRGAFFAALSANYLPDNYVMHIAGFGSQDSLCELEKIIEENNKEKDKCSIIYHGMLSGEKLNKLIDNCDIGISTNVLRTNFVNNTFPSKIMTYMTHNLHIVCGFAEAFAVSEISKEWHFFYNQDPESIANAIKSVDISEKIDNSKLLEKIDNNLIGFFKKEGFIE